MADAPYYQKKWLWVVLFLIITLAIAASRPVAYWRNVSVGVDSYKTHTPLFGSVILTQLITAPYPISGVAFIIVEYNKIDAVSDVIVTVADGETRQQLAQAVIGAHTIKDDTFAHVRFDHPLKSPSNSLAISLQAPEADKQSMLGVRFDNENSQPNSPRFKNGLVQPGVFAFAIREHVPLWIFLRYVGLQIRANLEYFIAALVALCIAISIFYKPPATVSIKNRLIIAAMLVALVVMISLPRIAIVPDLGGASGGDPYNYLFIAQSMSQGNNPFSSEKRLPGLPALLIPSILYRHSNDITVMRSISMISAAGTLVILGLLARALGLPPLVQLAAPALIAFQKDFFWTSIRPEPYTLYALVVSAALLLFFTAKKPWQQILYGLVLGYAAMTRQEGFMLAAVLGVCSVWMWRTYTHTTPTTFFSRVTLVTYLRLYIPALLVVTPFFISNTAAYGNPFFTPYFEGDRLQIVDSWEAFKDNLGATWGVISSLWRTTWEEIERYDIDSPIFLSTLAMAAGWMGWWVLSASKQSRISLYTWLLTGAGAALAILFMQLLNSRSFFYVAPGIIAALVLVSPIALILCLRWRSLPILVVILSQLLIVTWFHPFVKHTQHILPLISFSLSCLIFLPVITTSGKGPGSKLHHAAMYILSVAVLLPLALLTLKPLTHINTMIDKHNANAALDSVTYRAVKFALHYPGPYGADQAYLPARLYFGSDNHYFLGEDSTAEEETAWVKENGIRTLVTTNDGLAFSHAHPDWQQLAHFKSEGRNERLYKSFVYLIPVQ